MKKVIEHIRIVPAENGGHTVEHHYKAAPSHSSKMGMGMHYTEPEHHVFGKEDGHEMLAHVANHLQIEPPDEEDGNYNEAAGEKED